MSEWIKYEKGGQMPHIDEIVFVTTSSGKVSLANFFAKIFFRIPRVAPITDVISWKPVDLPEPYERTLGVGDIVNIADYEKIYSANADFFEYYKKELIESGILSIRDVAAYGLYASNRVSTYKIMAILPHDRYKSKKVAVLKSIEFQNVTLCDIEGLELATEEGEEEQ